MTSSTMIVFELGLATWWYRYLYTRIAPSAAAFFLSNRTSSFVFRSGDDRSSE